MAKKHAKNQGISAGEKASCRDAFIMFDPNVKASQTTVKQAIAMLIVARSWHERAVVSLHIYQNESRNKTAEIVGLSPLRVGEIVTSLTVRLAAVEQRRKVEQTIQRLQLASKGQNKRQREMQRHQIKPETPDESGED